MSNTLEEIQKYCKNKSVVIVGNSSSIFKKDNGKFIDSHNIVVRINYAIPIKKEFYNKLGTKTNIYIAGISDSDTVRKLIKNIKLNYILKLTPWNKELSGKNIYIENNKNYNKIKSNFGTSKPSSGCLAINFFKENIEFKSLSIIGFDFFKSSDTNKRNIFKSYLYKDHDPNLEYNFITNLLNSKIKLIY